MTDVQAQKLVVVLVTHFPAFMAKLTREQQEATQAGYRRFLLDLDYDLANAAIERAIATSKFFPTIAEIRAAALATAVGPKRAGGEAWEDVRKAIGRWGMNRTPGVEFQFADPLVARCVQALGWGALCMSENATADRARFIELYDEVTTTERTEVIVRTLPGQSAYKPALPSGTTGIAVNVQALLERVTGGT